jgi:hypothetical protein
VSAPSPAGAATGGSTPTGGRYARAWRRAAVVAGLGALPALGAGACHPLGRRLGWWGQPSDAVQIEVRNGRDVGVNVSVSSTVAAGDVFLGQVGPQARRTFTLRGHSPGTSVQLRAVPVDGTSSAQTKTATLTKRTVWDVP